MRRRTDRLYLRPNIAVEPLVDRWYAWPHLIAPATTARNLTERHLRIMESYICDPHAHTAAVQDPNLAGGPFMNYSRERVAEVRALRKQTEVTRSDLIELSAALVQLDSLLAENAKGFSLEPLYKSVPLALQGYTELAYDLRNQPSFRLIERLLYKSRFYNSATQSLAMFEIRDDSRPFIFSTPRLDEADTFHWQTPFDSELVDMFLGLRCKPASIGEIQDLFDLSHNEESLLSSLLTDNKPPVPTRYDGSGVRWKYFGHACVLIETRDCTILTDPAIGYAYPGMSDRLTYADLPESIDFVLLTHAHQDHVLLETLLQLRSRIGTILVPRNSGGYLQDPSLRLDPASVRLQARARAGGNGRDFRRSGNLQAIPFIGEHCDLDIRARPPGWCDGLHIRCCSLADSRNIDPALYRRGSRSDRRCGNALRRNGV